MKIFFTILLLFGSICSFASSDSLIIPQSLLVNNSVETPMNVNYIQELVNEAAEIASQKCQDRDASRLFDIFNEILEIADQNIGHSQTNEVINANLRIMYVHSETDLCQK